MKKSPAPQKAIGAPDYSGIAEFVCHRVKVTTLQFGVTSEYWGTLEVFGTASLPQVATGKDASGTLTLREL